MKSFKKLKRAIIWLLLVPIVTIVTTIIIIVALIIGELCYICGWRNNIFMEYVIDLCGDYSPIDFKTWIDNENLD